MFASSVQAFFIFKPWKGNQVYLLHTKWVMYSYEALISVILSVAQPIFLQLIKKISFKNQV